MLPAGRRKHLRSGSKPGLACCPLLSHTSRMRVGERREAGQFPGRGHSEVLCPEGPLARCQATVTTWQFLTLEQPFHFALDPRFLWPLYPEDQCRLVSKGE